MPWEKDAEGHIVVQDDKPVWVHPDGKKAPFDAEHTLGTITRLNGENKERREFAAGLEEKLKTFEGIEDPEAARTAITTVANLSAGELKTAAQVEEIKAAAKKAADEQVKSATDNSNKQIKALTTERDKFQSELHGEKIGNAFSRSKFVSEKIAVPLDMFQSMFGNRFKIDDGKIVGHDAAGNKIYSRVRNGELADFDEALEDIVGAYTFKDSILKGTGSSGSGAEHSRRAGGPNTMTRAEFEKLNPTQRQEALKTKQLVD